jgi:hypothetical protein
MTCAGCGQPGILLPLTIRRKVVLMCQPCITKGAEI